MDEVNDYYSFDILLKYSLIRVVYLNHIVFINLLLDLFFLNLLKTILSKKNN